MRPALLALGLVLVAAMGWAGPQAAPVAGAQESPRLASLKIGVWPEFDRPAAALVILSGELAEGVTLPATIALRVPASSGGPVAVASAASLGGPLLNIDYEVTDAEDSLLISFSTPDPVLQIEFYDPMSIDEGDRSYAYVWPGDLAVDQLTVEVQEPVGATALSVEPALGVGALGQDRLVYRTAEMGPFEADKTLTVEVGYAKTDPRTSLEILSPGEGDSGDGVPVWLIIVAAVAALAVVVGAAVYWRRQGRPAAAPAGPTPGARRGGRGASGSAKGATAKAFCTQCGDQLRSADRFCSQCGAGTRGG